MHSKIIFPIFLENVPCKFNMNSFIAITIKVSAYFYKSGKQMLEINNYFKNCTLIFIKRNNGGLQHLCMHKKFIEPTTTALKAFNEWWEVYFSPHFLRFFPNEHEMNVNINHSFTFQRC